MALSQVLEARQLRTERLHAYVLDPDTPSFSQNMPSTRVDRIAAQFSYIANLFA
jgi:hypothetical protein